jgi:hypothetical protein
MSQLTVGMVMERLLTDEALRRRFAMDPVGTLGELHDHGLELTSNEIDLFVASDVQLWFWTDRRVGNWFH